jgi:large subunit ribosomal protein L21
MFAVVKIGSTQYLVNPGQELLIDYQTGKISKLSFDQIYLIVDKDQILVGQPTVPKAIIEAEIVGQVKGDKIRVANFKAKSRFRKVRGFRPKYTKIRISKIKY